MKIRQWFGWVTLIFAVGLLGCNPSDLTEETDESTSTVDDSTSDDSSSGDNAGDDSTQDDSTGDDNPTDDGSTGGDPVDGNCPEADTFMEVEREAGAGAQYDRPQLEVVCTDTTIEVSSNGIPHYAFVQTTPNALQAQNHQFVLPRYPELGDDMEDIPLLGTAGVAVNGLPFYGPNEAAQPDPYGDPVANDILDECLGHTAARGDYHYHALLVRCLTAGGIDSEPSSDAPSPIIGYANDGFPVFGPYGCMDSACTDVVKLKSSWENIGYEKECDPNAADCSAGYSCAKAMVADGQGGAEEKYVCADKEYAWDNNVCPDDKPSCATADGEFLDRCNGRVGPDGRYGYYATDTFPYIVGCYRGAANNNGGGQGGDQGGGPGGAPGDGPTTCEDIGEACDSSDCPDGSMGCLCHLTPRGEGRCVPTCEADADCPDADVDFTCNVGVGICVPAGGPPG